MKLAVATLVLLSMVGCAVNLQHTGQIDNTVYSLTESAEVLPTVEVTGSNLFTQDNVLNIGGESFDLIIKPMETVDVTTEEVIKVISSLDFVVIKEKDYLNYGFKGKDSNFTAVHSYGRRLLQTDENKIVILPSSITLTVGEKGLYKGFISDKGVIPITKLPLMVGAEVNNKIYYVKLYLEYRY